MKVVETALHYDCLSFVNFSRVFFNAMMAYFVEFFFIKNMDESIQYFVLLLKAIEDAN